jgi:hypothetical protein
MPVHIILSRPTFFPKPLLVDFARIKVLSVLDLASLAGLAMA